ncbi:DedA family protein [Bacillus sp. 1NLA3E]|uniref:DedA family protein n=1 Tax=Bacillus sp. 1NLA3E TaxID=666686 RepID=UPI000247ED58|nr:DedA family protein [Bacillus sp. 1NLA3E]AGK55666.1 hypothetical protein B1NLA3E_19610 [Bacillus sp. 1NLA3E]
MSHLITIFEHHSYFILFSVIFLELLAVPISSEFFMSYAGYFVFQGKMSYPLAILTTVTASMIAVSTTYWIGRKGGYKLVEKYGRYIHFGPEKYSKTAAWMGRSGSKLLVFSYFVPGVRQFAGYISGISRIPYRKFIIPSFCGSLLWGTSFVTLGKVLGPQWEGFHRAASKYLVFIILAFVVLIVAYLAYRFYRVQIKLYSVMVLDHLIYRLRTIRRAEVFLVFLTLSLLGALILMLGLAQDYLDSEFTKFNEITVFVVRSIFDQNWLKGLFIFQATRTFIVFMLFTIFIIWVKGHNRRLEYLMLVVILLGAKPYHDTIQHILADLHVAGVGKGIQSQAFPDLLATFAMIIYGTGIYFLARHLKSNFFQVIWPVLGLLLLVSLAVSNIAFTSTLPSDIAGGYVYGSVWIFLNFLLFEMFRLVTDNKV